MKNTPRGRSRRSYLNAAEVMNETTNPRPPSHSAVTGRGSSSETGTRTGTPRRRRTPGGRCRKRHRAPAQPERCISCLEMTCCVHRTSPESTRQFSKVAGTRPMHQSQPYFSVSAPNDPNAKSRKQLYLQWRKKNNILRINLRKQARNLHTENYKTPLK